MKNMIVFTAVLVAGCSQPADTVVVQPETKPVPFVPHNPETTPQTLEPDEVVAQQKQLRNKMVRITGWATYTPGFVTFVKANKPLLESMHMTDAYVWRKDFDDIFASSKSAQWITIEARILIENSAGLIIFDEARLLKP